MRSIVILQSRLALSRAAAVAIIFALTACTDARSQVIGQWKVTSDTSALVWEFAEDGTVTSGDMRGRYSFGSQNRLKIQTPFATFVYQIELAGDKMTWKNPNGSKTELTRVK